MRLMALLVSFHWLTLVIGVQLEVTLVVMVGLGLAVYPPLDLFHCSLSILLAQVPSNVQTDLLDFLSLPPILNVDVRD